MDPTHYPSLLGTIKEAVTGCVTSFSGAATCAGILVAPVAPEASAVLFAAAGVPSDINCVQTHDVGSCVSGGLSLLPGAAELAGPGSRVVAGVLGGGSRDVDMAGTATGALGDVTGAAPAAEAAPSASGLRAGPGAMLDTSSQVGTRSRSFTFGDPGVDALGSTDKYGNITIRPDLSDQEFVETLRHETVHSIMSFRSEPLATLKQWVYNTSQLARFGEEAAAETYATRSLWTDCSSRSGWATCHHGG